jgi:DNA mismatch endonuclease (patch repair protein)
MTDVFSRSKRSAIMRSVRSADTAPERAVRRIAHALGYRFRLHRKDLPGNPDLVFPKRRVALFVHGCFWHGHDCRRGARVPASNTSYWQAKVQRNRARDTRTLLALSVDGWRTAVVWECETRDQHELRARLVAILEGPASGTA